MFYEDRSAPREGNGLNESKSGGGESSEETPVKDGGGLFRVVVVVEVLKSTQNLDGL